MIHQYTHQYAEPRYWVDPERGQAELIHREIQHVEEALDALLSSQSKGTTRQQRIAALLKAHRHGPLTADDIRTDAEAPRLVFRDIARNTDERTMISSILPPSVFAGNTLNYLVPWCFDAQAALDDLHNIKDCFKPAMPSIVLAYLCGALNSFTFDYVLRFKITTHVNIFYVKQLPVPRLTPNDPRCLAIANRVAQLVCIGSEFDELRYELLGSVDAHVATNPIKRQRLQNQIDALVAHLYGLQKEELKHILYASFTFPLVRSEIKDGVMAAFARVGEMVEEE